MAAIGDPPSLTTRAEWMARIRATRLIGHTHYEHIPFVSVQVPSHAKGGAHVMDQKTLIIIAIAAVVAIGAYFAFAGGYLNQTETGTIQQTAPK